MAMKYSWFHHHECTTEQADDLVASYCRRGATVERSLNRDNITDCQRATARKRESAAPEPCLAKQGVGLSMAKLPRRKCANKECRQWFHPVRDTQTVCGYECASAVGKEQTRKAHEDAQRKESAKQRATEKKERAAAPAQSCCKTTEALG